MRNITKILTLLVVCLIGMQANAQDVTIRPDNGSLIVGQAGRTNDESGFQRGFYSMWRHEQLPLTMTTSDIAVLTAAGEFRDPSCGIGVYNDHLILAAGQTQTFVVVSLPKGYRITGYRLVLVPDLAGKNVKGKHGVNDFTISNAAMCFYETPGWSSPSPYGNDTHSTQLTCPDAIATASTTTGETEMNPSQDANKEFILERHSQNPDDMGNQLHFFFARGGSQYGVTIKSFQLYFTAEGTFDANVKPMASGAKTDYVEIPFTTCKMDLGKLEEGTGNGKKYYYYDYNNVRDLIAYMHLYQDNAVSGGIPAHMNGEKNIYPVEVDGDVAYAFGNDTYFVEPPVTITNSTGDVPSPIGFRVVGAKFEYKYPTQGTSAYDKPIAKSCQITVKGRGTDSHDHVSPGSLTNNENDQTFYLNDKLMFTTESFTWYMDELENIGIELNTSNPRYLACYGEGDSRQLSLSSSASGDEARWNIRLDENTGRLYYYSDGGNSYRMYAARFQEGTPYHTRGLVTRNDINGNPPAGVWVTGTVTENGSIPVPAFNPATKYTLEVFGTEIPTEANPTVKPIFSKTVSSAADAGVWTTEDGDEPILLNNDALMFRISGAPEGQQALVNVTLELQALDPYIKSMDIVCKNVPNNFQEIQTFDASDFRVSGGEFIFYIPKELEEYDMTISFDNLKSDYADNTYYGKTDSKNYSRYSFVTSEYFSGTPDLYANRLAVANSNYEKKIVTTTAGNVRFKFNNAEDLGGSNTNDLYLREYLFDYNTYNNQGYSDPDGTNNKSKFEGCVLNAKEKNGKQKEGTYYVFTADETRYNIAPTTAWQHRGYAFYRMDIELEGKKYLPDLVFDLIYDKTCYYKDDVFPNPDVDTPKGANKDSMWGVKVFTVDENGNPMYETLNGQQVRKNGDLTYNAILQAIQSSINATPGVVDAETGAKLTSMKQLLYVDGSALHSMKASLTPSTAGTATVVSEAEMKAELGVNALIFKPESSPSDLDNVAYLKGGVFRAGKDFVLTDRYPFYTPYDIQVGANNKAIYTRTVTRAEYGKDILASVILPFTLTTTNGKHTNNASGLGENKSFSLFTMKKASMDMELANEGTGDYGVGYFEKVSGSTTNANVPYMVNLDKTADVIDSYSFVASQTGSKIFATKNMKKRAVGNGMYKYLYFGEDVATKTPDIPGGSVTLQCEGSYAGHIYDRAHSEKIFYFSHNKFLNLYRLIDTKQYLYIYPFRAVYSFDGTVSNLVKSLNGLSISFEDPGDLDGIRDTAKAFVPDLMVRSGKGYIQFTSDNAQMVNVLSLNGTTYSRVMLNAGDSKTISLPAGVYVVNNVKIIVK